MTLDEIGLKTRTDKSSCHHNYCEIYERYFATHRNEKITLVELGYGGYEFSDKGGEGARMWLEYFPNANIISIDLFNKTNRPLNTRFTFLQYSQDNYDLIDTLYRFKPHIIIDDASHVCGLTLRSFYNLYQTLNPGGWYVMEDIEGSFWDTWSRGTKDYNDFLFPHPVNLGRQLINDVNAKYIPGYKKQWDVSEIHFHQNIILIRK